MEAPQTPPALQNVALEGTSGTVSLGHGPSVWGLVTTTSLLWAELEPFQNLNLVTIS